MIKRFLFIGGFLAFSALLSIFSFGNKTFADSPTWTPLMTQTSSGSLTCLDQWTGESSSDTIKIPNFFLTEAYGDMLAGGSSHGGETDGGTVTDSNGHTHAVHMYFVNSAAVDFSDMAETNASDVGSQLLSVSSGTDYGYGDTYFFVNVAVPGSTPPTLQFATSGGVHSMNPNGGEDANVWCNEENASAGEYSPDDAVTIAVDADSHPSFTISNDNTTSGLQKHLLFSDTPSSYIDYSGTDLTGSEVPNGVPTVPFTDTPDIAYTLQNFVFTAHLQSVPGGLPSGCDEMHYLIYQGTVDGGPSGPGITVVSSGFTAVNTSAQYQVLFPPSNQEYAIEAYWANSSTGHECGSEYFSTFSMDGMGNYVSDEGACPSTPSNFQDVMCDVLNNGLFGTLPSTRLIYDFSSLVGNFANLPVSCSSAWASGLSIPILSQHFNMSTLPADICSSSDSIYKSHFSLLVTLVNAFVAFGGVAGLIYIVYAFIGGRRVSPVGTTSDEGQK